MPLSDVTKQDFLQRNIIDNPGLKRYIGSLAKQRLRFVWGNDRAIEREDIEAELMLKAVEAARKCEAKGIDGRHCTNTLRVAVTNHSLNLATRFGSKARNPLTRVSKADKFRTAWWTDLEANSVIQVMVSTHPRHRKNKYILTCNTNSGLQQYCHVNRLFDTEEDARKSLKRYRVLGDGKRKAVVDLTVDMDDFQPTTKSFDLPTSQDGETTLYNFVGGKKDKSTEIELNKIRNPKTRACCALALGCGDYETFRVWAQQHGCDIGTTTYREFLRLAMEFCGVEKEDLERALTKFRQ
ncbi:MAG: hypothetical protein WC505_06880 [Patescibacteria group bacterium]